MRPLLLDLFCCQGGAAAGYHAAGFDIVGIDIDPQPLYPFPFIQGDALRPPVNLAAFDAIHASPPCRAYTTMGNRHGDDSRTSPPLIRRTRELLQSTGLPYVIENVMGARSEMPDAVMLDGSMFGLPISRQRLFESNVLLLTQRTTRSRSQFGIYGKNDGRRLWTRADGTEYRVATLAQAREAMGMPWADWHGCKEAIPPAYTEHIGRQLLAHVGAVAA